MAYTMTHLHWRNGRAYVLYRLGKALESQPVPSWWPEKLAIFWRPKESGRFREEIWEALGLGKGQEASAKGKWVIRVAELKVLRMDAEELIITGPSTSVQPDLIELLADQH